MFTCDSLNDLELCKNLIQNVSDFFEELYFIVMHHSEDYKIYK